jgi:hypothetical protein
VGDQTETAERTGLLTGIEKLQPSCTAEMSTSPFVMVAFITEVQRVAVFHCRNEYQPFRDGSLYYRSSSSRLLLQK